MNSLHKSEILMSKTTFRRRATVCSKKIYRRRTMFKTIHKSLIKTLCFWKSGQFGRDWRLVRITPPVWLRTKSLDWTNFENTRLNFVQSSNITKMQFLVWTATRPRGCRLHFGNFPLATFFISTFTIEYKILGYLWRGNFLHFSFEKTLLAFLEN